MQPPATVAAALAAARAAGVDRLDALALLQFVTRHSRAWLRAHEDAELDADAATTLGVLLARRAAGEPLAYLVGEREFHGLALHVTPDVLIPRPDTETLVDWALELLPADSAAAVADLGTGSGAIALALKNARPAARVTAVDASAAALAVARANGERLGLEIEWLHSDWWSALAGRRFDLVLSNPPYIEDGDAHLADLRHEPLEALTSGSDGLDAIRAILATAATQLEPGAWLLFEHGHDQAEAVCGLLTTAGFEAVQSRRDLAGHARCSGGRRPR
jgi:release factor glutamine methyltransferase